MRYSSENYGPSENVEVLRTKPSERPYEEIAELAIQLRPIDQDRAILNLKEKAKLLGADAIIILGENSRGAVAMPMGSMTVAVPIRFLSAVAIRYKR